MTLDAESTQADPLRPWGYVATFLWVILAAVLSVVMSVVMLAVWLGGRLDSVPDVLSDGPLLSGLTFVSTAAEIGVLALAAHLAHWRVADYLGWAVPNAASVVLPLACMAVFVLGYDALTYLLNRDVITAFQIDTYRSARDAGGLPMLWVAFVIAAPLGEETVFRGFLYRGWAQSPRAVAPAIAVISALWAIIHVQYDWFGILQIFLIGLILGWARWRSGSTLLTFGMHGLINAWAMFETMAAIEWKPIS